MIDNCWLWGMAIDTTGYGVLGRKENGKIKKYYAHRVMYEVAKGKIPKGHSIDHLCRIRRCINPKHLEAVTPRENNYRGNSPKWIAYRNGTCVKGHDKSNFQLRKNGKTVRCKKCRSEK